MDKQSKSAPESTTQSHDPAVETGDGQWTSAQLAFMKRAIAVMSTILVIGFAVVIGRIFYLSSNAKSNSPAAPASSVMSPGPAASLVPLAELALPSGAEIMHMSFTGRHIAVHYRASSGAGIAIMDLASGTTVTQIKLGTQAPQ